MIGGDVRCLETLVQLVLDELRSSLVPLVGVLVEDSTMMLLWVLAAFENQQDKTVKLRVRVIGEVDMLNRLNHGQHVQPRKGRELLTQ